MALKQVLILKVVDFDEVDWFLKTLDFNCVAEVIVRSI